LSGTGGGDLTTTSAHGATKGRGNNGSQSNGGSRTAASNETQANGSTPGGSSYGVTKPNTDSQELPPQPGTNRNGVRLYLKARMPTFNFSPNELRTLVRFFLAVSSQQEPFIKEPVNPLTDEERTLARQLFTSQQAPCLKCHLTGNPEHDKSASAPNFLQAGERLQPGWTFRWLLDPQKVIPGTAMPSELFKRDGERWVFNGELPPSFNEYKGDHADLLVRYMLQLTPMEQARLASGSPAATGGTSTTGESRNAVTQSSTHHARPRAKAHHARPRAATHHAPRRSVAGARRGKYRTSVSRRIAGESRRAWRARAPDTVVFLRRQGSGSGTHSPPPGRSW